MHRKTLKRLLIYSQARVFGETSGQDSGAGWRWFEGSDVEVLIKEKSSQGTTARAHLQKPFFSWKLKPVEEGVSSRVEVISERPIVLIFESKSRDLIKSRGGFLPKKIPESSFGTISVSLIY